MKKPMLYEELLPKELKEIVKKPGILYFPIGSLEWHSKHLPFGLDALVSYELCKKACEVTGGCVIPPLYFGTDREHNADGKTMHGMDAKAGKLLPGSLYFVNSILLLNLLRQVVNNVKDQGFKKMVIISAHSGTAQQETLETLVKEKFGKLKLFIFPGRLFADGGIDHAGQIETSLMLAINPKIVHRERIDNDMGPIDLSNVREVTEKVGKQKIQKIVQQIVTTISQ